MKKRVISLILAISVLLSLIPPVRAEEETAQTDIETLVAEQIDAFIATLKPEGASEGAAQLVKNSIKGGGDMKMTEKDAFGKAIFSSKLFRLGLIRSITQLHQAVHARNIRDCLLRTNFCWYEYHSKYYYQAYLNDDNGIIEDSTSISETRESEDYSGPFNTYDEAMMLVVGESRGNWDVRISSITADSVTYQINVIIEDSFSFDGDTYTGDDRDLEEFINWVGTLLSLGLLTEFDWQVTTSIEIILPNDCTHQSGDYRWEYDGTQDLVSMENDTFLLNPLTRRTLSSGKESYTEHDVFYSTSYVPQVPIRLLHDHPWTLEWVCFGVDGSFVFGSDSSTSEGVYLRMAPNTLFFGNYTYLTESDEKKGYCHYGVWLTGSGGVDTTVKHTYTLTNRIFEDGTNMVYLSVDGREMGAMNNFYISGTSMHKTDDWVSGQDFVFSYIGNNSRPLDHISVDYIQVWENGEGNGPFSYLTTSSVSPTCTADGGTLNTCSLCGAEFLTDVIPATGHDYTEWRVVKEATCTAEGKMERSCRTCGHRETRPVAVIDHVYTPTVTAPTCVEEGFTTYVCACGESYVDDYTEALGHDFTEWQITDAPNCTEAGMEERWCLRCEHRESRVVDATGHHYEAIVTEATCTVGGYTDYVCECGDHYRSDYTSPAGHQYETEVTEATCTVGGYTTYTCFCGDSYKSNYTGPAGHQYEAEVTEATCTVGGYTTYTCFCGDSYKSNFTSPVGHQYEAEVTEATCTIGGYTTYTCFCGDSYKSNFTGPAGHDMGEWETVTEATCTGDGFERKSCSRCDHAENRVVKALGHDSDGVFCTRCGVVLGNPFTDVPAGAWFESPVLWALQNGITNGLTATEFGPNATCNRAQVVTFLWRAAGCPEPTSTVNPFVDVAEGSFYEKPVLWAVENGITNGADATHFNPNGDCNRAQVVTFLYRAFQSPAVSTVGLPFTDVPADCWYEDPIAWAVENGITNGLTATEFGPNSSCNRAQVVTFLYRAYVS